MLPVKAQSATAAGAANAWDIAYASFDGAVPYFYVGSQDTATTDLFFKPDGTKVYTVGSGSDTIYQYSLSVAWDVSSASYDSKSFSVATQETVPTGLFFKTDGTKMYVTGTLNDRLYQYSLSTAWDVSTASYDGVSHNFAIQTSSPQGIYFKSDGTRMFLTETTNDSVYQYSLSTPWDVSTMSYDSVSFSLASQTIDPSGIFVSSDGTKMYIAGNDSDTIFQYTLGTGWNLSTASYASKSFNVAIREGGLTGVSFKSDLTRMFFTGSGTDAIFQCELSVAGDLSTASVGPTQDAFYIASEDTNPRGLFLKPDGTKMYVTSLTNDMVYQYSLSTAWSIDSASYDSISFSTAGVGEINPQGLFFKSDGTKMYLVGSQQDAVFQFSLSSAWDLSTATYDSVSFSIAQDATPFDLFFKSDGTKMYVVGASNDTVYQYSLATAWNVGTASYDSISFSVTAQDTAPGGLFFKSDGTKMYVLGNATGAVYQYSLATAWNVGTASYDSVSFSVFNQETNPTSLSFESNGTKMYVVGTNFDTVIEYQVG